jgi:hypothetical protein
MFITFDAAKQRKTLKERGLDFSRAAEIFKGKHFTATDDCSGLIKPDTILGGKITTLGEVFNGKTTTYVFNRIQT